MKNKKGDREITFLFNMVRVFGYRLHLLNGCWWLYLLVGLSL
jgi:hypothetical protein